MYKRVWFHLCKELFVMDRKKRERGRRKRKKRRTRRRRRGFYKDIPPEDGRQNKHAHYSKQGRSAATTGCECPKGKDTSISDGHLLLCTRPVRYASTARVITPFFAQFHLQPLGPVFAERLRVHRSASSGLRVSYGLANSSDIELAAFTPPCDASTLKLVLNCSGLFVRGPPGAISYGEAKLGPQVLEHHYRIGGVAVPPAPESTGFISADWDACKIYTRAYASDDLAQLLGTAVIGVRTFCNPREEWIRAGRDIFWSPVSSCPG